MSLFKAERIVACVKHVYCFLVKINEPLDSENINSTELKSAEKTLETFTMDGISESEEISKSEGNSYLNTYL